MIIFEAYEMPSDSVQDPCWVLAALSGGLQAGSGHALGVLDDAALLAIAAAQASAAAGGGVLTLHGADSRTGVLLQVERLEWAGERHVRDTRC